MAIASPQSAYRQSRANNKRYQANAKRVKPKRRKEAAASINAHTKASVRFLALLMVSLFVFWMLSTVMMPAVAEYFKPSSAAMVIANTAAAAIFMLLMIFSFSMCITS